MDHLVAAEPDDQGDCHTADEFHERVLHAAEAGILDGYRVERVYLIAKTPTLIFFPAEGLDDSVAGNRLIEDVCDIGGLFLGFGAQFAEDPAEFDDGKRGDRQNYEGKHGKFPVHAEDNGKEDHNLEKIP